MCIYWSCIHVQDDCDFYWFCWLVIGHNMCMYWSTVQDEQPPHTKVKDLFTLEVNPLKDPINLVYTYNPLKDPSSYSLYTVYPHDGSYPQT
jgi:hypothetical protein